MSSGEETYSESVPVRRRVGRPRKHPIALPAPPIHEPDDDENAESMPAQHIETTSAEPVAIPVAAAAAIAPIDENRVFRCAKCKRMYCAAAFGINKKGKRVKVCRSCSAQYVASSSEKKQHASQIDWSTIGVRRHPVHENYGAMEDGRIVNMKSHKFIGSFANNGYIQVSLQHPQATMYAQRFVWECYNGVITDRRVVKHLDNRPVNNAIANLALDTQSANIREAWADGLRERTHIGKRAVIATNMETGETREFSSMTAAARELGLLSAAIKFACDGIYDSTRSKTTGARYSFRYTIPRIEVTASSEAPSAP